VAIHAGQAPEPIHGSVNVPIHMSSTYAQTDINTPIGKFDYTRGGNPTREALEICLTAMEYGKYSITFASGCGALASIMHTLSTGDHVVACDDVYGGTNRYMRVFMQNHFGVKIDFVDLTDAENLEKAIKPETKLVWMESPTNPTMKVLDLETLIGIAKKNKILTVVDNTFCSPIIQSPLLLGADIVFHSATKYLGGHSDIVMGALVIQDEKVYKDVFLASYSIGANPSPFDCYLVLRSLKTLEQRVYKATHNAYHLAHFLQKNESVENVMYPGLKSDERHEIAKKQMRGFGGMISFRIKGGKQQVSKFLKAVRVFTLAESLGGVESLAQNPYFMTHASVPEEQRKKLGITENLIRLSLGVESTDDLIMDVEQALKASQQ